VAGGMAALAATPIDVVKVIEEIINIIICSFTYLLRHVL
jgi:hypothetical protein